MSCPECGFSGEFWLLPDGRIICADDDCYAPNGNWNPDDLVPRAEFEAAFRTAERVRKDYRALTAEVIAGLTTAEHEMTMFAGLPECRCRHSLGGGDASGAFITHALAKLREGSRP